MARPTRTMAKAKPQIPIPQAAAACTAFAAFSVSIFVGIASDNPVTTVLSRALLAMVAGFAGGFFVGLVCDWLVREEIARVENGMAADSAASAGDEVGLDGLTGVDVIDEDTGAVAEPPSQSESSDAVGRRREKSAA